jgi:hypothetical protein
VLTFFSSFSQGSILDWDLFCSNGFVQNTFFCSIINFCCNNNCLQTSTLHYEFIENCTCLRKKKLKTWNYEKNLENNVIKDFVERYIYIIIWKNDNFFTIQKIWNRFYDFVFSFFSLYCLSYT